MYMHIHFYFKLKCFIERFLYVGSLKNSQHIEIKK